MRGDSSARTWAEVDLDAIARNIRRMMDLNPHRALIAVVKADAYGHGAIPVARTVIEAGAAIVGVGDSREAIELLRAGLKTRLLILGDIVDGEMESVVAHDVRTTVHSRDRLHLLEAEAAHQSRAHSVHLKVDTGMGRLGMMPERVVEAARFADASPHLRLEGLATHFANSHLDRSETTNRQVAAFREIHDAVCDAVGPIPLVHCRNTAAAWNVEIEDDFSNAIRIGAAMYGIPGPTERPYPFEPAMSLMTQVIFLKDVPGGMPIGYNGTFVTERPTRIAVLPIGYADGFPSGTGKNRTVLVRGTPAPILGAVSMDYTTVDVTHIPGAAVGDEALLFGRSGEANMPLETVAAGAGISNYAVTCGLSRRVRRIYRSVRSRETDERVVAGGAAGR